MNLTQTSLDCLADSARWFPELHSRGTVAVAVHFALGMAGEVGEWIDAVANPNVSNTEADLELADVCIYALNLAALVDVDPGVALRENTVHLRFDGGLLEIMTAVGYLANAAKKANRSDTFAPRAEMEAMRSTVELEVPRILAAAARQTLGGCLADCITTKRARNAERFGADSGGTYRARGVHAGEE